MRTKTISIFQDETICANCQHFYQHYVRDNNTFTAIVYGHCAYPRLKDRMVSDSCQYFRRKDSDREALIAAAMKLCSERKGGT